MKFPFCIIVSLLPSALLFSQQGKTKITGMEIFLFGGVQKSNFDNLTTRMNEFSRPAPGTFSYNGGTGLAFRYKKYSFGAEMSFTARRSLEKHDLAGSYIRAFVSANLLRLNNVVICPQLGLGFQRTNITTSGGPSTIPDFNHHLFIYMEDITLYNKNTMLDLALCLKLLSKATNSPIPIFRVGYRYGLTESEWKVRYITTENGPKDRANTLYCQLMFGLGN